MSKEMYSINVRFDPINDKCSVWFSYSDGSFTKDSTVFNMEEEEASYELMHYLRSVQDQFGCDRVYFY